MSRAVRLVVVAVLALCLEACTQHAARLVARPPSATFWCPMHPAVRGVSGDQCSICQMSLVPIAIEVGATYTLDVEVVPSAPVPGASVHLRLSVRSDDGAVVTGFDVVHEKLFHLFVVSRDLRYFRHLHPTFQHNGEFDIDVELPHPGHYQLIADFQPIGSAPQMLQRAITTANYSGPLQDFPTLMADLADQIVGGTRVKLSMREATAGGPRLVTVTLLDAETGEPATGIEPYLGASGHLVSANAELTHAAHSHPLALAAPGSTLAFQVLFPTPGMYRIWVQFQRRGSVQTASFTIPVGERQRVGM